MSPFSLPSLLPSIAHDAVKINCLKNKHKEVDMLWAALGQGSRNVIQTNGVMVFQNVDVLILLKTIYFYVKGNYMLHYYTTQSLMRT